MRYARTTHFNPQQKIEPKKYPGKKECNNPLGNYTGNTMNRNPRNITDLLMLNHAGCVKAVRYGLLVALAASLVACAYGNNFVRPAESALVLGVTTKQDVNGLMGRPVSTRAVVVNDKSLDILNYVYSDAANLGASDAPDVVPGRLLQLHFYEDMLVGKLFRSSFESDSTFFKVESASRIKPGTTEQQLYAVLGAPNGVFQYPLTSNQEDKGLIYEFNEMLVGADVRFIGKLAVVIDPSGIVKEAKLIDRVERTGLPPLDDLTPKWSQLKTDMSQKDVYGLLGVPSRTVDETLSGTQTGYLYWHYPFGDLIFSGYALGSSFEATNGRLKEWKYWRR
ncbi:MAG: hypothetical protein R3F42_03330 [Pseudomonadota bacterium]